MTSNIHRLLVLVFVLFAAACTPAQSPYGGGGTSREDPNADARWLLGAGKCLATFDDLQAGETETHIQYVSGEPAADNPKFMAVRKPILDELLSYSKASDKADKEKHAQSLRELFQSVSTAAARPFETMLETDDALAVKFRTVLKGDALKDELLGALQKKYAPPAPPPPPAPAQTSTPSLALPAVTLTDEASFGELHKAVKEQIDKIEGAAKGLSRSATVLCKERFEKISVPSMRNLLADTEKTKIQAFEETDASKRAKGLKKAGDQYLGAFYLTQIVLLELNFILVTDWADGEEQGERDREV